MPGVRRKRASAKNAKGYGPQSKSRRLTVARTTPRRGVMAASLSKTVLSPFPPQIRCTMRYFTGPLNLNGGAGGTAANHVFSANGCYDPDITGVGHQPIGFDQLMVMYDHYTVVGAKIVVDFRNDDTTNPYNVGIRVTDSITTIADTQKLVENGYNVFKLMNLGPYTPTVTRLVQNVDIAKFLGRKDVLADPELKGTSAANPTEQVNFHVFAFTLGPIDGAAITFQATIEFDTIFHERKAVDTS